MQSAGVGLAEDEPALEDYAHGGVNHWYLDRYFSGDRAAYGRWMQIQGQALESLYSEQNAPRTGAWRQCLADIEAMEPYSDEERERLALASGLNTIFRPFLTWTRRKIESVLRARGEVAGPPEFSDDVISCVLSGLAARLNRASLPTASLLANIARLGSSDDLAPKDRTTKFAGELLVPQRRRELLGRFPRLEPRLAKITVNTTSASLDLLQRLSVDREVIVKSFGVSGDVTHIEMGLGDYHCHGKTVSLVSFGSDKIVYKPRNMRIDTAFAETVNWIRQRTGYDIGVPLTVDRGEYGWAEFVSARECRDEAEVSRAFENMGSLLACLHLCGASDIHFENLIFSGAQPYAVDLETVLGAPIRRETPSRPFQPSRAFFNSVIKVGYLPTPVRVLDRMIDLSAAGLTDEIEGPFQANVIEHADRDDVPSVIRRGTIKPEGNSPILRGVRTPASANVEAIAAGFDTTLRAALEDREGLLAPSGPMASFRNAEVRHVARATAEYAQLQLNANHPALLKDDDEILVSFSRLSVPSTEAYSLDGLIPSEIADLLEGDVPYFYSEAEGTALLNSSGEPTGVGLEASPLSVAVDRVRGLSDRSIFAQTDLVRRTFAVSAMVGGPEQPSVPFPDTSEVRDPSDEVLLTKASEIASDLIERAVYIDGYPHWFSPEPSGVDRWTLNVAGADLYNGFPGIGLFFARLYKLTGLSAHRDMAARCLTALRKETRSRGTLGGFEGIGGLAYADYEIAKQLGDFDVSHVADRLSAMTDMAPEDQNLDLIAGVAGALLVAVKFRSVPQLEDLADRCAEACGTRLLATAIRDGSGTRWQTGVVPSMPLTGFSHGTSGMALALAKWGLATGASAPIEVALDALRFESASFCESRKTWWDLRNPEVTPCTWCHGAAGMVLARVEMARCLGREAPETLQAEIDAGLAALELLGGGGSHSLCHGLFGNIDPILRAGDQRRAREIASVAISQSDGEGGWRTGVNGFRWAPGLMTGVAGIGLGLISLIDADEPDVLVLE